MFEYTAMYKDCSSCPKKQIKQNQKGKRNFKVHVVGVPQFQKVNIQITMNMPLTLALYLFTSLSCYRYYISQLEKTKNISLVRSKVSPLLFSKL